MSFRAQRGISPWAKDGLGLIAFVEVPVKTYYVYIMASKSRTLYTGVTSNLERRVFQHRRKLLPGFTARYNVSRLVYYETSGDVVAAITREKQIKSWGRMKKIALIESANRDWKDLSDGWHGGSA